MVRHFQPRKIIEVGSGFSSALILDTLQVLERQKETELTFIEPDPSRLFSLVSTSDRSTFCLRQSRVQDVKREVFQELGERDLLFIDSSHVMKCGSDLQYLLFEIIPLLRPGVMVHFHDIFYPFEYPEDWLLEGKGWNEVYVLRAFLAYNVEWEIVLFAPYVGVCFADFLAEKMPICLKNTGGSLYLRRKTP